MRGGPIVVEEALGPPILERVLAAGLRPATPGPVLIPGLRRFLGAALRIDFCLTPIDFCLEADLGLDLAIPLDLGLGLPAIPLGLEAVLDPTPILCLCSAIEPRAGVEPAFGAYKAR